VTSHVTGRGAHRIGLDEFPYKFGWLQVTGTLHSKEQFNAEACNHPNCLVLPFRFPMIRAAA